VAGAYWYRYARDDEKGAGDVPVGESRFTREREPVAGRTPAG
jgi:hypothetical protein